MAAGCAGGRAPAIALITTCGPAHLDLLPQFVHHYRRCGVTAFRISLHFDVMYGQQQQAAYTARARRMLEELGLDLHASFACPHDAMAVQRHHETVRRGIEGVFPWIVWADLDEFHEFPDELPQLVAMLESRGCDCVRGHLVDRLARRGFPELQGDVPLWRQFPLGTDVTRSVLGGCNEKVMLARSALPLSLGNHAPLPGMSARPLQGYYPVHHFKWDASVIARLRRRLEGDWRARCWWWPESERGLAWIAAGGPLEGVRAFDFEDDSGQTEGGPWSGNPGYLRTGKVTAPR